jgi:hypothetical protein
MVLVSGSAPLLHFVAHPAPLGRVIPDAPLRIRYQIRPGSRVVTSWTIHVLPSGSLKEKNDP